MEAHHDLRKFITESSVAQRCAVLSSGRDADRCVDPADVPGQHWEIVGRLTPWAGIESSTAMGSDQTAAEALQEAETEVGAPGYWFDRDVKVDRAGRRFALPIG